MDTLVDLILGRDLRGVPEALKTLRDVMSNIRGVDTMNDDEFNTAECWRHIREGLKGFVVY